MKAIIFAAGVGRRLQAVTKGRPKCLVDIGGRTLLSRHVENLTNLGVRPIVLVVGFGQALLRESMAADPQAHLVRWVLNEQFTRGSITSLWAARKELNEDSVLMDADVLYHPVILARLIGSPFPTALLMDESVRQQGEECMVAARQGRVVRLSKVLPDKYDESGEGVGFLKVQKADIPILLQSIESCIQTGRLDMEYEDAMTDFFSRVHVGYEKIGGKPWIEIDFPEDVLRADREILPAIRAMENNTPAPTG